MVCVWFCIHNNLFVLFLLFLRIQYITFHCALVIRMTLLICQSSFSICVFIILIPACVYLNMHTHFPPLVYSYTSIATFICISFCCVPAKKWGDTEIAERGRSVLVMRARYRSAGLIPHQRGWTDAG